MRRSSFGAIVLKDVAWGPVVKTGASGPGYSRGAEGGNAYQLRASPWAGMRENRCVLKEHRIERAVVDV